MKPRRTVVTPYLAPLPSVAEVAALAALGLGTATADQQKRAIDWIIRHACRVFSATFVPGDSEATHVLEGRRQAGLIIIEAMRTSTEGAKALTNPKNEGAEK